MEKLTFRNCDQTLFEKTFGLVEIRNKNCKTLREWIESANNQPITDLEQSFLLHQQNYMIDNIYSWNEQEWIANFIGPVISLVQFSTLQFNAFNERIISAVIDDIELLGKVDGMIARGRREPEKPYFCLQEYKKEKDTDSGDPVGQALSAMLVAQAINNDNLPIYGGYVRGRDWFFMVLEGKEYAISRQFDASEEDLLDIFRILKALKEIVAERIKLLEK
jgi:hypothetical protein